MTDQTESASPHAALLRDLDSAAAGIQRLVLHAMGAQAQRRLHAVHKEGSAPMSDKLPEWPTPPCTNEGVTFRQRRIYLERTTNAALARMEALVEYAQHKPGCRIDAIGLDCGRCTCGLDELLAACERRSGG